MKPLFKMKIMEDKTLDGKMDIKWLGLIIFIIFWVGFLAGVWVMSIPKNSVNIGSSGENSSININQTKP